MDTKEQKQKVKKIDMAQHEYKMRAMGISDRARKLIIRALLLGITIILLAYWIIRVTQQ